MGRVEAILPVPKPRSWAVPGRVVSAIATGCCRLMVAGVLGQGAAQAAVVTVPAAASGIAGLPSAPSGFASAAPGLWNDPGLGAEILEGFNLATTVSGTYNSNITQSPGQAGAPALDDFIVGLGGSLGYQSKAREWTFGGTYQGSYDAYCNHPDFSGFNQSGGISGNYEGGKFNAALSLGISRENGSNRYYGASNFIEQTRFNAGLTSRYRLSPKTTLTGEVAQSFATASGGNYDNTNTFSLGTAALWRYSPLTEFGPGIRYTADSGAGHNPRTTIGPTVTVNYKLSSRVAMNSRLGLDIANHAGGGSSDPSLSAVIGLNYRASQLWGMNFSLFRDAQADPTVAGRYSEITALRLGYQRKIRRATLNLGVGYETNRSLNAGSSAGGASSDQDYLSLDGSLGMAVFSNTTMASIFLRYNDQRAGAADSFDSMIVGINLSRSF